ncbi:MAG: hypothetical protein A4E52_01309 [Pelotomaculum sp. PtaB.Bin013]|uniref:Uncharacterized protein n=1 Tax=Pelotomaculum isophthalicicum JI TaxID=947010 RepID=A0A9X4JW32_9FIRM|nr:hypothetical protein [Pelotomaculum isophthalicicum]MDF9408398.1 hypothetical protein [Pelotomaculum isophthalicicum JI]OPX87884.1 MAG: hypothetical protein A4E52_01309 [Pelotomaculum sp. PtaB.Bin013]
MKHTYLFLEGIWLAKGIYYDENGNPSNVEGQSEITHLNDLWLNNSYMTLSGEDPVELRNDYEIVPFEKDFTSWKSFNPGLGTLLGRFVVIDDSIISLFSTEKGDLFGSEFLTKINDSEYIGKGVLYNAAGKISSWSIRLVKEEET